MLVDILGVVLGVGLIFVGIRSIATKIPLGLEQSPRATASPESAAKLARSAGIVEIATALLTLVLTFLHTQGVLADDLISVLLVIIMFELFSTRWLVLYMMKPKE